MSLYDAELALVLAKERQGDLVQTHCITSSRRTHRRRPRFGRRGPTSPADPAT